MPSREPLSSLLSETEHQTTLCDNAKKFVSVLLSRHKVVTIGTLSLSIEGAADVLHDDCA
jgi:hypothetical protein